MTKRSTCDLLSTYVIWEICDPNFAELLLGCIDAHVRNQLLLRMMDLYRKRDWESSWRDLLSIKFTRYCNSTITKSNPIVRSPLQNLQLFSESQSCVLLTRLSLRFCVGSRKKTFRWKESIQVKYRKNEWQRFFANDVQVLSEIEILSDVRRCSRWCRITTQYPDCIWSRNLPIFHQLRFFETVRRQCKNATMWFTYRTVCSILLSIYY